MADVAEKESAMGGAMRFALQVIVGALLAGAAGLVADAVLGIMGWWLWGICAGAIAGALASYVREGVESRR